MHIPDKDKGHLGMIQKNMDISGQSKEVVAGLSYESEQNRWLS